MTAYALFAHGSRIETANQAVRDTAARLAAEGSMEVEAAFLELGTPSLPDAVRTLVERGFRHVVVIPYFLTLGTHLQRDLPRLAAESARLHGPVTIDITPPLDGHPGLLPILLDRAASAVCK